MKPTGEVRSKGHYLTRLRQARVINLIPEAHIAGGRHDQLRHGGVVLEIGEVECDNEALERWHHG